VVTYFPEVCVTAFHDDVENLVLLDLQRLWHVEDFDDVAMAQVAEDRNLSENALAVDAFLPEDVLYPLHGDAALLFAIPSLADAAVGALPEQRA
jgi:hypothetical protein